MKKVIIIGGGLGGLLTSIQLARAGVACMVIEKKRYPFHRVCGEYISNEVVPFLQRLGLYPEQFNPPVISRFMLSAINGRSETLPLDLGGFGISRYVFDEFLFFKAQESGVEFLTGTTVENVEFVEQNFLVRTSSGEFHAEVVVGSYGKRSSLDIKMNRAFTLKRSPYVGVKYHFRADHPSDLIALHNFRGGYCGVSRVEDGKVNVCYLVHREKLRRYGNIDEMEKNILHENPHLRSLFTDSSSLFNKAETINEISFARKSLVQNGILMVGDAAGMITPLCGNGMAMAIHGSSILSGHIVRYFSDRGYSRQDLERDYRRIWERSFSWRLFAGRTIQGLFGSETGSRAAIGLALYIKPVAKAMIRNTHGTPF